MEPARGFPIAGPEDVKRILERLARAIDATLEGELAIVGIRRRGAPLAADLIQRLERRGRTVLEAELTIKRYTDDLAVLHEEPRVETAELPDALAGRTAVVVDDVLYSGRTMLRAVERVLEAGAGPVHCAALCSRGRNDVPIRAEFVGLQLDVGPRNIVEVQAPPYEPELAIALRRLPTE